MKTVSGVHQRQRRDVRLSADHQLQLGQQVGEHAAVLADGAEDGGAKGLYLVRVCGQHAADRRAKRLRKDEVRVFTTLRLELAAREHTTGTNDGALQLVDQRRLTNARVAGHEYQTAV